MNDDTAVIEDPPAIDTTRTDPSVTDTTKTAATVTTREAPAAPATPPAAPDPSEWRTHAVAQVFGEAKDDDPPETKTEREKLGKLASKYNTPGDALKALREAQAKISAGLKPLTLPKDATPEQVKEFRATIGVPETPEGYDLGLPKGTVLADGDKALLDSWVTKVHGANAPPEVVKAGAAAMVELRDGQLAAITQRDVEHLSEVEEVLREEWGNQDYKRNIDAVKSMLGQGGEGVQGTILNARGADGRALANNPAVLRWLAAHARELGYVGSTVVPSGGDLGASVAEEIEGLKTLMRKDLDAWHKNTRGQGRYIELVNQQHRLAGKKTAA